MAVLVPFLSVVSVENDLTAGCTRRSGQTLGNNFSFLERFLVEYGVKQLIKLLRFAAKNSGLLVDKAFANKIHGNFHHSGTGALTITRLEEPELAFLYGELHILHIVIVVLELVLKCIEFFVELRHCLFHRRIFGNALLL